MPRRRRYFEAGAMYEIVFRAREGLPLPCLRIIELILKSALARAQRERRVTLSHYLWMANHPHMLVVARDARKLVLFYGELEKRITDCLKRLLGLDYLDLWEGRPTVIRIADHTAAIERIAYAYVNPSKAGLVNSIHQYPGCSTWKAYQAIGDCLTAQVTERVPLLKLPAIPRVPKRKLSETQDHHLVERLLSRTEKYQQLTVHPNAWMKCFGITERQQIMRTNEAILENIHSSEAKHNEERLARGIPLLGPSRLLRQPIMLAHIPKKKTRKIFVICRDKQLRLAIIAAVNIICDICAECYSRWIRGDFSVRWPPGTFIPPLPPLANALATI